MFVVQSWYCVNFFFLKSVSFKIPTEICTDEASDICESFRNKQWVEG